MQDKHGKNIKVGDRVKDAHGFTSIVTAVIATPAQAHHRLDVEVIAHAPAGSKAADGDSIIWGS